ncbi:hypothetical protein EV426DRAFT_705865 [Tirmania nivea]|nr:hypothetical protein EV426DRAFT_705865 [Tirmania nivea]
MPEEITESAPLNGTTTNDTNVLNAAASQLVPAAQDPAATRRAIITNAHVLERVTGPNHGGEHSGDEVTEDEGPEPEVIANDEDLMDDFPLDIEEVELVHLRIGSIALLKLERFSQIQKLCLRQNHIYEIEALDHLSDTLKELDLYDNGISSIRNLEKLTKLETLDLSFNKIRHIKRVNQLAELRNLYFVQNKISRIEGLEGLVHLRNLELGANKIRVWDSLSGGVEIDNLDTLQGLEELWLGKNKISQLKNLSALANLKILSIQSNRLTEIMGLENLVSLEEFYISHNAIREITGLENNIKLRVLDVTSNRITKLSGLKHLENLEELWASNNKLSSFEEVAEELGDKKKLSTVYFEGNPLQVYYGATYRNKVRLALPQIQQIDASE